jgi:hypothetical protein
MGGIPQGLEQGVGEAQGHQVLHGFLAEIVVDTVDGRFGEDAGDGIVDGLGGGARLAQRLFDDHAAVGRRQPVLAETVADRPEEIGADGQIEDPDAVRLALEGFFQILPARLLGGIDGHVVEPGVKTLAGLGGALGFRHMGLDGGDGHGLEGCPAHGPARGADDAGAFRYLALIVAMK